MVELTRPGSSASTRTRNALGVGDLLDPRDRVGVQLHRRTEASKNPRTFSAVTEDLYRRSIRGEESPSDSRRLPNLNYVPAKFELRDGWNGATTVRRSEEERRNDGATVGGGEREEHRVGEGGRTRKATGEGRAGTEEDKETQVTTP